MARNEWGSDELEAAIRAYVDMYDKDAKGQSYSKKSYYRKLSEKYGRSDKSYEYRMQNISFVFSQMGRPWVKGLKPAKNVGANVAKEIERLIYQIEGQSVATVERFRSATPTSSGPNRPPIPIGNKKPKKSQSMSTQFERDDGVIEYVLDASNGECECCETPAPFKRTDGTAFLEVHHVKQLADDGSDTISNAIAVCPNCHRELHFGANKNKLLMSVYKKVIRLVKE